MVEMESSINGVVAKHQINISTLVHYLLLFSHLHLRILVLPPLEDEQTTVQHYYDVQKIIIIHITTFAYLNPIPPLKEIYFSLTTKIQKSVIPHLLAHPNPHFDMIG